jgi:magnesium transporter
VRVRASEENVDRLDRLFYMIVDEIVDGYQPVLDKLADEISEIEDVVLDHPDPETLSRIFSLKRKLVEFRRIAGGMREVVNSLIRRENGIVGDDLDPYFRDIYDHIIRTVDLIETYRDLLSGALDIYLSAVANRTNEVMKVLTIWGTVALPLVIITGFFGMNLHLPWADNPHGIDYAVGLMAISTIAVLVYFKMKHWF